MATVATLKLEIDARGLKRGLATGKKQLIGFQKSAISLRGTMVALAGVAGFAFAAKKVFDLGSAVEETASKFRTVFGPAADSVQDFIDDFGVMAGLSTEAAQEIVATTGAIVQGMGFAQEASAAFAEDVVRLAGDLSSFNNIPVADTSRAIQAALTGERESLKRLGVVILETDVQKRAFATTGKDVASALTQEERAAATLALITERAGVAVGDLARTQDSAANVARRLGARWQNLKEVAASSLLPIMAQLLDAFDKQTESTSGLEERIKSTARSFQEFIIQMQLAVVGVGENFRATAFLLEEFLFQIEQAITKSQILDAKFNLLFAEANIPLRMLEFFKKDLPDSVRLAELALNNLTIKAAERLDQFLFTLNDVRGGLGGMSERTEELLLRLNALRVPIDDVARAAPVAAQGLNLMGIEAAVAERNARGLSVGLIIIPPAFANVTNSAREAADALRRYNEEASKAAQISGFLGKALTGASILGGLGPVSGVLGKAASFFGLFDHGGSIPAGKSGIVGERGPELVQGPAQVTSRTDTARMMGGDMVFNFEFIQEGVVVRRITQRQRREDSLGVTYRLAIPAPAVG